MVTNAVNDMFLCLGCGCSAASLPIYIYIYIYNIWNIVPQYSTGHSGQCGGVHAQAMYWGAGCQRNKFSHLGKSMTFDTDDLYYVYILKKKTYLEKLTDGHFRQNIRIFG